MTGGSDLKRVETYNYRTARPGLLQRGQTSVFRPWQAPKHLMDLDGSLRSVFANSV